jgi:cysteine desulfurase / selenocysteine lyase
MTALATALKARLAPAFPVERIRADFPILKLEIGGKSLVYLDNAASSQMPPLMRRAAKCSTSSTRAKTAK